MGLEVEALLHTQGQVVTGRAQLANLLVAVVETPNSR